MVDGLLRVEADATLKRIASRLAQKWKEPFSCTCRYMKSRVAITLVQATYCGILGGRVPMSFIIVTCTQCEFGAGFHLFR